jgi:TolB-like protein
MEKWQASEPVSEQSTVSEVATEQVEVMPAPQPNTATQEAPGEASVAFQKNYRDKLLTRMGNVYSRKADGSQSVKNINYYVRGLMQELVGNLQYVNATTPIAVTSFVFLDGSFNHSDLVGMQIAESFVHEVHKFGIPVLDFKTTDFVRVTQDGDFVLSKDYLDLEGDLPIRYVVAGTLVKHLAGYMVNARIIGIQSKAVVASAQGFLPASVINSLVSSNVNDGIPLTATPQE